MLTTLTHILLNFIAGASLWLTE